MAANSLNFEDLDELVELLKAAGVRSVDTEPARVNLPGVLVDVQGFELEQLAGLTIQTRLLLIAKAVEFRTSTKQLQDLFNQVVPVLQTLGGPTGTTTVVAVTLPGSQSPLPALSVPFDLLTTQE